MIPEDGRLRLELYLRADVFGAGTRQRAALDALDRLDAEPWVEGTRVFTWKGRVRGDEAGWVHERVSAFLDWADANGVSLAPALERREVASTVTGERFEEVVLPVMCLAVYDGEDLRTVAPYVASDGTYTVPDCLADLADRTRGERALTAT